MFNIFRKETKGQKIKFKITGMHCASCAMNIDGALEDTAGVISASTSYAKSQLEVEYDEQKVSKEKISQIVAELGYEALPD